MPQGAACIQSITGAENMNTAFKIIMAAIYFWLFSITFGGIVAHGEGDYISHLEPHGLLRV